MPVSTHVTVPIVIEADNPKYCSHQCRFLIKYQARCAVEPWRDGRGLHRKLRVSRRGFLRCKQCIESEVDLELLRCCSTCAFGKAYRKTFDGDPCIMSTYCSSDDSPKRGEEVGRGDSCTYWVQRLNEE